MPASLNGLELHFLDHKDHQNANYIDKEPDTCPVCDQGVEARFITAYGKTDSYHGNYVQVVYKCPRLECQALFIAYYTPPSWYHGGRGYDDHIYLQKTFVQPFIEEEKFDEEVKKLSPKFVSLYSQASTAENFGLVDICGAGYRKALEHLVKDYLSFVSSDKIDDIKTHSLGYLIANEIQDERIKKMAGLAKDIGNDETHYIKKIEELSLEDMKKLIKLCTHWIVAELLTADYAEKYDQLMGKK